ncbi:MAG: hypothetical protein P1U32_04850, partial [Legionellaceae bacterium]|nr:hypothetical protein [Legionellaceae bacterium]
MPFTPDTAIDVLEKYGKQLRALNKVVSKKKGILPKAAGSVHALLYQQLTHSTLRALEAIAYNKPFNPVLLNAPGSLPSQEEALLKGAFGTPPDPYTCLKVIFGNEENHLYINSFERLARTFYKHKLLDLSEDMSILIPPLPRTERPQTANDDEPEEKNAEKGAEKDTKGKEAIRRVVLDELIKTVSAKELNVYFKAMKEV